MTVISLIAALDENWVIGREGAMPWPRIPADMAWFYSQTVGKPVLMGRRTYEAVRASIGQPLPRRINIVLTRQRDFRAPGCLVAHSLDEAVCAACGQHPELMVIGGEEIYRQFLPAAGRMYLTFIASRFAGDRYFPEVDWEEWRLASGRGVGKGEESPFSLWFGIFERLTNPRKA